MSHLPQSHYESEKERSSMVSGMFPWRETPDTRLTLRRRDCVSSSWFGYPESELSDVWAIHTIEMIPKSMILTEHWFQFIILLVKHKFIMGY